MKRTFRNAFIAALADTRVSIRQVADASGVSYEQLKKLNQGKSESTNVEDAQKIALYFNRTLDEFLSATSNQPNSIAVAGYVGAGAVVPLEDAYVKGDGLYLVECPPQVSPHGVVAVEVQGDSMEPAYSQGDVLFYSRETIGIPTSAIGLRCVCEDINGHGWVKIVKRREGQPEGLFDLHSINADAAPMYDVRLVWAAPIKMHLQAQFVRKIN